MNKYQLVITEAEEALLARIDFDGKDAIHSDRHAAYLANKEPILALLASLNDRGAIPDHRVRYWTDPEYNPGRVRGSREQIFARNGSAGNEAYTHPNFVKHLRYILFGAELPSIVMTAFEEEVGNPKWVSYGDALELGKFARSLVRLHHLRPEEVDDEFFKLSLDIGLTINQALRIRQTVKETR